MSARSHILLWSSLAGLLVIATLYAWPEEEITHESGILCPNEPMQTKPDRTAPWLFGDYMITPLASYRIHARVLSRENYRSGREAELSPVDLALGWGKMSDQMIVDRIDIAQSGRRYRWRVDVFPIPRKEIERTSANVHIIPADESVQRMLNDVVKGMVVDMQGYLVKATADDGWRWSSSLRRTDTGDGACEVFWVEDIRIDENPTPPLDGL